MNTYTYVNLVSSKAKKGVSISVYHGKDVVEKLM